MLSLNQKAQEICNKINMPLVSAYLDGNNKVVLIVNSGNLTEGQVADKVIWHCSCAVSKKFSKVNQCSLIFSYFDILID